ncbi:MAG: class I SAM-dependent methyltransferase [Isosphaeraceae bacterium]
MAIEPTNITKFIDPAASLSRCLACAAALEGLDRCPACGRAYPVQDGIFSAIGPLTGRNRVAAAFYDGPAWQRFRPWERAFLRLQGGQARARNQILRHLPNVAEARVLEVGIGDGENLTLLPKNWTVYGVDIARTQLVGCLDRFPELAGRLTWAEAEALPFLNATFDAVFCIGGFNFFRDHAAALAEMRRVARPGAPVIIADERPDLGRFGIGHLLGVPALDLWWVQFLGLDRDFAAMALDCSFDPAHLIAHAWPGARLMPIWSRLGYCLVGE